MKFDKYIARFTQTHWTFAVVALIFGTFFIALTPPLWGPDENVHFARTYQVSRGSFTKQATVVNGVKSYGGGIPQSLVSLNTLKDIDINDHKPGDTKQVDSITKYAMVGGVPLSSDKIVASPFGELAYPTVAYLVPASGVFIDSLFQHTILPLTYAARAATLIFYVALVFISLYILRQSSFRWAVFIIALLPSTLYQASVVSADPLLTSLCLLLFAFMYRISHTQESLWRKYVIPLALVSALIALIKPPYMLFILILPFLYIEKRTSRRSKILLRIIIPLLSILITTWMVSGLGSSAAMTPPGVSFHDQLNWIFLHPAGYIYMILNSIINIDWVPQIIGIFGSSFILVPMPIVYTLVSLLALTTLIKLDSDKRLETNKAKVQSAIYIIASMASVAAIITTLFLAYTRVGLELVSGVQGRYFIPILPFLLYGIRILIRSRLNVSDVSARVAYPIITSLCLAVSILWYYKILY